MKKSKSCDTLSLTFFCCFNCKTMYSYLYEFRCGKAGQNLDLECHKRCGQHCCQIAENSSTLHNNSGQNYLSTDKVANGTAMYQL